MFELAGTHFEKGVFELRLEKANPGLVGWIQRRGPVLPRLFALGLILAGGFLSYFKQPGRWLLNAGLVDRPETLGWIQSVVQFLPILLSFAIYMVIYLRRSEEMNLVFDRLKSQFRFRHVPAWKGGTPMEGLFPINLVGQIRVLAPEKEPKSPHGRIQVELKDDPSVDPRYKTFEFQVLTDEQREFFPLNLSKMVGVDPTGDWVDPSSKVE